MNELIVLLTILFLSGIGYLVIRTFNLLPRSESLSAFAYSYGLGVGLVTMQMYLYSRIGIAWNRELLLCPWGVLFVLLIIIKRNNFSFSFPKLPHLDNIDRIFLVGIALSVAYVILEALIRPVTVWDAWAIWLLKSKGFFIDGGINPEFLNYVRSDYPLLVSLLGTFVYIMIGAVDDTTVLLTSTAFYLFLGLALFSAIKKTYGVTYALIITFLYITTQNFIRHGGRLEAGQADLPLGYFMFISALLLLEYLKQNSKKVLLLLSTFLGFTVLIKFEGIPFSLVAGFFILRHIISNRLYQQLPLMLFWLVPLIDWQIYKQIYHLSHNYFSGHKLMFSLPKIVNAVAGTVSELINIKTWNFLWIIYFYTLTFFRNRNTNELFVIHVFILIQLSSYVFLYMFTADNDPQSSIERLLVHIAPLALYSQAILFQLIQHKTITTSKKQILNNT